MRWDGGDFANVYAKDLTGTYVACRSTSPGMIAMARALNSDSYIHFEWDTLGVCTALNVVTSSYHAPKTP
ncbi:hypothetical protein [Corallococcus macrosporus]|uniref:Uncharacterized protein n=1 Tax=Corallococcus macrosporus DSM 14697 TaxID=1189310 RepID=A0A250K0S6_9BACT|nr:hypothetical protein [Corallococcus macrosporus]ATB49603.1 hypothetical protein MYMAC_005257 [Corallococcus macrosporus DSM 14697]